MEEKILKQLQYIENEHNVKVLFAVESGSRSWGFASEDSDWDVRFVYVHPLDHYIQPTEKKQRDVIEWMSDDRSLDLVGWDLKKTLINISKSNTNLGEWLCSKIVYINEDGSKEVIDHILRRSMSLQSYMHHYRSLANKNWNTHFKGKNDGKMKKYFYIIRPILMMILIMFEKKMYYTVDFEEILGLCKTYIPKGVYDQIHELLRIKRDGSSEENMNMNITELHDWIEIWLSREIAPGDKNVVPIEEMTQHLHSFSRTYFPETNPLVDPCKYSFSDLLRAAGREANSSETRGMTQARLNNEVKMLCADAGWHWHDVNNRTIFTAFSPELKK